MLKPQRTILFFLVSALFPIRAPLLHKPLDLSRRESVILHRRLYCSALFPLHPSFNVSSPITSRSSNNTSRDRLYRLMKWSRNSIRRWV